MESRACAGLAADGAVVDASTIEIGISAVLSGGDAPGGANTNAATLLAIDMVNADTSILPDHTLVPTFADDAGEFVAGFLSGVCLADRGVPVTIGPTHSGASMGFGTISRQTNMPFLSPSASSPKLNSRDAETGFPLFSRNFPSDDFQGVALADLAQHYGWTTCATISQSADEYSEGLTTTFSSVADSRGIGISSQLSMGTGDSDEDIATKLTQAKNSGTRMCVCAHVPILQG
jgi:branched-chain amino acid transport system substrate-binding protein